MRSRRTPTTFAGFIPNKDHVVPRVRSWHCDVIIAGSGYDVTIIGSGRDVIADGTNCVKNPNNWPASHNFAKPQKYIKFTLNSLIYIKKLPQTLTQSKNTKISRKIQKLSYPNFLITLKKFSKRIMTNFKYEQLDFHLNIEKILRHKLDLVSQSKKFIRKCSW